MFRLFKKNSGVARRVDSAAFQSVVLTAGRGLGFVVSAATPLVLVRVFDLEGFGVYKILFLVASTTIVFCNLGFNASIFYFVPRAEGDGHNYVVQALLTLTALGAAGGSVLLFGAEFFAELLDKPQLVEFMPIIALYVLLAIPGTSDASLPIVDQKPVLAAWIMVGTDVLRAVALVAAGLVFGTVYAVAWAALAVAAVRVVILVMYLIARRESEPQPIRWENWKKQILYAVPFGIAIIFEQGLQRGHQFFVTGSASAGDFAIYAIGVFQIPVIHTLVSSVAEVVIVQAAPAYQRHDTAELRRLWTGALKPLAVLLIPIWAVFEVVAPELITVLFGTAYTASYPVFRVFLLAILVHIILDNAILRATGDTRFLVWANALGFLTSIGALFVFTRIDLLLGAVWSYVIGLAVIHIVGLSKVAERLDMGMLEALPWKTIGQAMTAAVASGACAQLAMQLLGPPWLRLAGGLLVFGGVYGWTVWLFQLLPREQILSLARRLMRGNRSESEETPAH